MHNFARLSLLVLASGNLSVLGVSAEEVLLLPIEPPSTLLRSATAPDFPRVSSLPLAVVAVLESTRLSTIDIAFGDTDGDGLQEIIALQKDEVTALWEVGVFEEQGNGSYTTTHLPEVAMGPRLTGDLDADGKREIVGAYSGFLRVYESPDGSTFPTVLTWQSPALSNVLGHTAQGDTDRDGRQELIHSLNSFAGTGSLKIFENTGDNTFAEVFSVPIPGNGNSYSGQKVIFDLDGDGWDEIAMGSKLGTVLVYEASGDNTWSLAWSDSTGLSNSQRAAGGWDLDGNGKPEFYITGNNISDPFNVTWDTHVYEAVGNNEYVRRAVLSIPVPASGVVPALLADLDGDGDGEYIMWTGVIWVFDAECDGTWSLIGSFPADGLPYCHDLNRNGRSEIVFVGQAETPILEHNVPIDAFLPDLVRGGLTISPNPFRREAVLDWSPSAQAGCRLLVYDVAGHLVESRRVGGSPFAWSVRSLPSGVYFVHLRDPAGRPVARSRAIVTR